MNDFYTTKEDMSAVDICTVITAEFADWLQQQPVQLQNWVNSNQFKAEAGSSCLVADAQGKLSQILLGLKGKDDFWAIANLPAKLPAGCYQIDDELGVAFRKQLTLAWGLGCYQFNRYKQYPEIVAKLRVADDIDVDAIQHMLSSIFMVRDLINTPTQEMNTGELADVAKAVAKEFKASFKAVVAEKLLKQNFPLVYAVGRGSAHAPRLVEMNWGDNNHPRVTLIGKGICFDSGGLDLKSHAGMLKMKKDMSGAAHALGLARMIMAAQLPIQLQVILPIAENAISGNAYHPGDVLKSRLGKTVEVTNTDAEGRLVLADALTFASESKPDLIIDFATLTGAAWVALGADIMAMYCTDDEVAAGLLKQAEIHDDLMWRMPLYQPYAANLESEIAELQNTALTGIGGSIEAALFLQAFVADDIPWVHFDFKAWNDKATAGRPLGGDAKGLRAVFAYLQERFCI